MTRPTFARVNLGAIRENVRRVCVAIGPGRELLVAVKADAYGHGAVRVSQTVIEAGATWLGVAFADEARPLREAGITAPILVLGASFADDIADLLELDLTPSVSDMDFARALSQAAVKAGRTVAVHVHVDTGMGRIGFQTEEALRGITELAALPGLKLEAIMTHFPSSDESDRSFTLGQLQRMNELLRHLEAHDIRPPMVHTANTGAVLDLPQSWLSMVRLGIGAYGYYPSPEAAREIELTPSLSLHSRVVFLKTCPPGKTISYGRTYTTHRHTLVATVPVGYADGYSRGLSNRGTVIVVGRDSKRSVCPVIGRVCMDQIMIDVTAAPEVRVGDPVIVYSDRREDPNCVESVARTLGTIPHEVTCGLSRRVPRTYLAE